MVTDNLIQQNAFEERQASKANNLSYYDNGIERIVDLKEYLDNMEKMDTKIIDQTDNSESAENDKEQDPARKFQFNYDSSVCLTDRFPEAAIIENKDENCLSFAPGEGKIPENILLTKDWDIDAFPMKHPDGKNGLHQDRERKLSDQYYFVQRLRNRDSRFSSDPSYT